MLLEDLERRYPLDPSGFHRHAGHAARPEPVREVMQVSGKSAERADWHIGGTGVHRSHVHRRPNVDLRRAGVDHLQIRVVAGHRLVHDSSSIQA